MITSQIWSLWIHQKLKKSKYLGNCLFTAKKHFLLFAFENNFRYHEYYFVLFCFVFFICFQFLVIKYHFWSKKIWWWKFDLVIIPPSEKTHFVYQRIDRKKRFQADGGFKILLRLVIKTVFKQKYLSVIICLILNECQECLRGRNFILLCIFKYFPIH